MMQGVCMCVQGPAALHVRIIIAAMRGHLAECKRDTRAVDQPVRRVQEHVARAARLGAVVHVHAQRRLAAQRLELDHQVGPGPGLRVRARARVRVRVRVRARACLCRALGLGFWLGFGSGLG